MLQTVKVFLAETLTATACRSVSSLISLNRTDLLMHKVTPPVALSPGEPFVIPEKPVKLIISFFVAGIPAQLLPGGCIDYIIVLTLRS